LAFVSARGVFAFSIAVEGATLLKPLTPLADAASRGDWLMVPLNPALAAAGAAGAAGVIVAACAVTVDTAARQASAPAAERIEKRFTEPIPPLHGCLPCVT
jgi:hypothetical protein